MAEAEGIYVAFDDLRPTQMTVGFREVEVKRREWREADGEERAKLLRTHIVPTVLGPKGRHYIVDHHHFARALQGEGLKSLPVYGMADLQHLQKDEFWTFLDNSAWCHAYDAKGRRCELGDIPKALSDLADDPYRSLVGELVRAGGCAKSPKPFFEFLWADFLRRRIDQDRVRKEFATALTDALAIARGKDAKALPGWCGPDPS
jgi:hypothetical protein